MNIKLIECSFHGTYFVNKLILSSSSTELTKNSNLFNVICNPVNVQFKYAIRSLRIPRNVMCIKVLLLQSSI